MRERARRGSSIEERHYQRLCSNDQSCFISSSIITRAPCSAISFSMIVSRSAALWIFCVIINASSDPKKILFQQQIPVYSWIDVSEKFKSQPLSLTSIVEAQMRRMFPKQYGLDSAFVKSKEPSNVSSNSSWSSNSTISDPGLLKSNVKKTWRLRRMKTLIENMLQLNRKCKFRFLLQHYCPVKVSTEFFIRPCDAREDYTALKHVNEGSNNGSMGFRQSTSLPN